VSSGGKTYQDENSVCPVESQIDDGALIKSYKDILREKFNLLEIYIAH